MEKKERQKIYNTITLNVFLILIIYGVYSFYLAPEYDALKIKIEEGNALHTKVNQLTSTGVDADELQSIMIKHNKLSKGMSDLFKEKQKINKVIKPEDGSRNYITWLKHEVIKGTEYSEEDDKNKKIIGNIIPVFYQYSSSNQNQSAGEEIKGQITLDSFTKYVEDQIIRKYDITSFSSIGIENITFGTADPSIPQLAKQQKQSNADDNIGSFTIQLDFEGKNKNIMALIDSIQKSGRLEINSAGKLINTVKDDDDRGTYSSLDNLLINIDQINVSSPLLMNEKVNRGVMTLRFYVRGVGYEQLTSIKESINKKFTTLYAQILEKSKLCENPEVPICKDNAGSQAVATIRNQYKEATQLKARIDTLVKDSNDKTQDINQSLTNWLNISSLVDSIEASYKKSAGFIDNFNKKGNR